MQSFDTLDAKLTGRCANGRKVGNNTYAERRGPDAIAIRLHATDVVTFHRNGNVELNTGGWLTVTTKARINEFTNARVHSVRGRWFVAGNVPFADGMTFRPDGSIVGAADSADIKSEDKANADTRRKVRAFVKSITAADILSALENTAGDCWGCKFATTDHPQPMGTSHLTDHIDEHYVVGTMLYNAVKAKGYRDPSFVLSLAYAQAQRGTVETMVTDSLRKYLYAALTVGTVAAGNGHKR